MVMIAIASAVVLVLGGYMATLKADFVQGLIMMVGVSMLVIMVVASPYSGGWSVQGLSDMASYMEQNGMKNLTAQSAISLVSMILMTSIGTWGLPQMVHKYYGIRDDKEVKEGRLSPPFCSSGCRRRLLYRFFFPICFRRHAA